MKLKPYLQKLISFRKFGAVFIFLTGMALMTVISRAADSFMIPQVSVSSPEEMKLKYPLEIQGNITAKEDRALYCQENLRISQVHIQTGSIVKKGDLLFSIDKDNLQTNIQQTEQEIQKLDLQIKDLEQSWHNQVSQHELALNRAEEDYTNISNTSEASVNAAYLELENAREELALHDSQKPDVSVLDSLEEENPLDIWSQKRTELEQVCLEKQKLYEEAIAAREEALKAAARQIEDADQPVIKDNSSALLQIEKANLTHILQELQTLSQTDGSVYSEYDGQISECTISTGSMTSSEPVILLADFSQSFQFEGILNEPQGQSLEPGTEGTLRPKQESVPLEHVKISSISQEENEIYQITADLDSYEISQPQEAVFDISKESRKYPCCVPLSALYIRESGDFVIRIQENPTILGIQTTAEYVPVSLLEKNDQYAAVEGELSSSDQIIVNASKNIKEGDPIRIVED